MKKVEILNIPPMCIILTNIPEKYKKLTVSVKVA